MKFGCRHKDYKGRMALRPYERYSQQGEGSIEGTVIVKLQTS